jgi:hypothetical protein
MIGDKKNAMDNNSARNHSLCTQQYLPSCWQSRESLGKASSSLLPYAHLYSVWLWLRKFGKSENLEIWLLGVSSAANRHE